MRIAVLTAAAVMLLSANTVFAQTTTQPQRPTGAAAPAASAPAATAGHYASEGEAKSRCGSDSVVWMNTNSGIYHYAGNKDYGHTKEGAYMCKTAADKAGRAAKTEKGPKTTAH